MWFGVGVIDVGLRQGTGAEAVAEWGDDGLRVAQAGPRNCWLDKETLRWRWEPRRSERCLSITDQPMPATPAILVSRRTPVLFASRRKFETQRTLIVCNNLLLHVIPFSHYT